MTRYWSPRPSSHPARPPEQTVPHAGLPAPTYLNGRSADSASTDDRAPVPVNNRQRGVGSSGASCSRCVIGPERGSGAHRRLTTWPVSSRGSLAEARIWSAMASWERLREPPQGPRLVIASKLLDARPGQPVPSCWTLCPEDGSYWPSSCAPPVTRSWLGSGSGFADGQGGLGEGVGEGLVPVHAPRRGRRAPARAPRPGLPPGSS